MTKPKFYDTRGRLTAYALGCGYVAERGDVSLWREHGKYHVRKHVAGRREWWHVVDTLKEARKIFDKG